MPPLCGIILNIFDAILTKKEGGHNNGFPL